MTTDVCVTRVVTVAALLGAWLACVWRAEAAQTVYPSKDGTLADGGIYGSFDGVADDADWYFNQSSYEGSITLATDPPESSLEHRVVWEYNLSGVTLEPPVSATLTFTIRGAPIWPLPDVDVHVYSYPADLQETLDDFPAGPAVFQGSVTIEPYQTPTEYSLNVADVVSDALDSGDDKVAFRFQIDPDTPYENNQAFIDALDSNPSTKPFLTIDEGPVPGDFNDDGEVDLTDYAIFADCMAGPDVTTPPEGCFTDQFSNADLDNDGDVDLGDFGLFQYYFGVGTDVAGSEVAMNDSTKMGRADYFPRACFCSFASAARGRACSLSCPIVASQRYTLAAETPNRWANSAAESPSCLRSRATDLPVGRIFGAASLALPPRARPPGAPGGRFLRTAGFCPAFLETLDCPLVGTDLRRVPERGFFPVLAATARLSARPRFPGSAFGAGC